MPMGDRIDETFSPPSVSGFAKARPIPQPCPIGKFAYALARNGLVSRMDDVYRKELETLAPVQSSAA
jgi:hypothetical protein